MKPAVNISAAVLAGVLAMGATAPTAEASAAKTTGTTALSVPGQQLWVGAECMTDDYRGRTVVRYARRADGSRSVQRVYWSLLAIPGHPLGNKNNVSIRIRQNRTLWPDKTLYEWVSEDNIQSYSDHVESIWAPTQRGFATVTRDLRIFVEVKFTFDRLRRIDPKCTARTADF